MEGYLFGILVVLLVFTGVTGGLGILIYIGTPKRRPTDASDLSLPLPANVQTSVEKLLTLNFQRLGETYTRMPLAMSPGPTWIFNDETGTIYAEILEINPGAYFTTVFADGAVVETGFPQGEDITRDDFISQTVTTRIEDAYQLHLQNVENFQSIHGAPQVIGNMQDYLHWDSIYRARHAQRKLRRVFSIDLAQVVALLYGIIVSLVMWLLWEHHAPLPQWLMDWDQGLFILLSPAFVISLLSLVIGIIGGRRNRKRTRQAAL